MKRTAARRPSTPAAPRMVAYLRVSSDEQAAHGVSLAAQRDRLASYAHASGFDVVRFEEDAGVSGGIAPDRRPAMARALAAVRAGEADGILAIKLDRFSRSTKDTLALVDDAERRGWRLVSVSEALDTGTAAGRFVVTVLGALAEMERAQVGERTTFAMERIAREGRARSRFVPFGFRLAGSESTEVAAGDRSPLVPNEAEQAILARILALAAEGHGDFAIAGILNAEGTPNPRQAAPWTRPSVRSILATSERRRRALDGGAK